MTIYNLIMQEEEYRKEILIKFGFGEVQPKKVESWFKKKYPSVYNHLKRKIKNGNVITFQPREVEAMTKEQRNAILDKEERVTKMQQQDKKVVKVHEEELNNLIELKRKLEYENEGYFNLINAFIESRDIRKDFLNFIEEMKKAEESQEDSLYMGDLEWHLKDFE